MNDRDRVRFEACKRSAQFGVDNPAPVASILETRFNDLQAKVAEIETAMGDQEAAGGSAAMQFDVKDVSREDVIELMTKVANAARAAEPEVVGIQERFRFNRNLNDAGLLAACNSFLAATSADQAFLVTYGAPTNWHADLTDIHDAFSNAFSVAAGAFDTRVAATATVRQKVSEAMQIKRTLGFMVPNYFDTPGQMAAWQSASHVEALPSAPTPPTPPTP